jgi:hypothetical protein
MHTPPDVIDPNRILLRRQVILAPSLSSSSNVNEYEPNDFAQQVKDYNAAPVAVGDKWLGPFDVNSNDVNDIPMYLAKGVDNFSIRYCPIGDINSAGKINWRPLLPFKGRIPFGPKPPFVNSYPQLIKFTFTLYDSKKILKGGRRFEHIVYIGN